MADQLTITGIGSRQTPQRVMKEMIKIGAWCLKNDILVRSGHAEGADYAFEKGAKENCIAYLPWKNFGMERTMLGTPIVFEKLPKKIQNELYEIAPLNHPAWSGLSAGVKKIIGRNMCQVRGHLERAVYSQACVYWTHAGNTSGGTVFTRNFADKYEVPCFNMQTYETATEVIKNLEEIL